jgi:nucleoid DNA-binding protein
MALPMVKTIDLVSEIAEETGYSKSDVRHFLTALEESIVAHIGQCERVKIGNLIQLEPKLKKKTKERQGRNPRTGDPVTIAAKPSSVRVAARVLKGGKEAAPPVKRLKRALEA